MLVEHPILAVSVSTGWAVRNFFQTGILAKLKGTFDLVVFTNPIIHENLLKQGYGEEIRFIIREDLTESLSWRLFRQLKKKLYMESRKSSTEEIWKKYVRRPLYQKLGGAIIQAMLKILNPNSVLGWVEKVDFRINNCGATDEIFQKIRPDLYFATHASTFFEESLLHSAARNNVPVVFMVLSWDHLSSKVVLSRRYRSIYVWNDVTKTEILQTCPAYGDDQVKVVGVPQYDIYAHRPTISYLEWCAKYKLDPGKRTVLFSTMPQVRHEQQHVIIERILSTIVQREKLPSKIQLLIKCHPFDNESKYDYLLSRYPVAICKSTLGEGRPHEEWFPGVDEMEVSRDSLYFTELNINIFSTVTLEAAYFDKPIIHIAFDPNPVRNRIPCREYYNFEHFRNITKMNASIMVYNYEELYDAMRTYLNEPAVLSEQRRALVKQYFTVDPGYASDNVVRALLSERGK